MVLISKEAVAKPSNFQVKEHVSVKNSIAYCRFLNWVIGEFDLFLKNEESESLKVYFPNGWFSVSCVQNSENGLNAVLKVEGKSKTSCLNMVRRIKTVHGHICQFHES